MRRSTSSIWPRPERWGERGKRYKPKWLCLNWECDQQMWTPKSAGIIGGRRVMRPTYWMPRQRGTPTVSVALLRMRRAYRARNPAIGYGRGQ